MCATRPVITVLIDERLWPETEKYLTLLGLWDKRDEQAGQLSGGMKRRLMIARALVHEPRLLILDEPTAGVDIEIRRSMWDFLREINRAGTTIILTTHYLEEAEHLCRNIGIIDSGSLVENTSMRALLRQLHLETYVLDLEHSLERVPSGLDGSARLIDPTTLEIDIKKEEYLNHFYELLSANDIRVRSMRNKANRLEELFINRVGQTPSEEQMTAREQWIAYVTIVLKEIARFMRIWQQTLIPPAISTLLYFVIFGNLIGQRIGQMDGFDYMDFLVPGLILMAVINASYQNVVGSFFGAKWGKSIEELLVSPTPNSIILLAYITGGVARGMLVGLIVTGISLLFTDLNVFNLGILTAVMILTAVLFSLGGFVNAIFAKTFDDVSMIPTFVLLPLTYLGGVFYSIHLLSDFWQQVSKANPILYMVNAFRYGFLGISDVSLSLSFGMIGLFIISFFALSLYLLTYSRGLRA